jgi:TRAP transporter 4TM/12TM fusion protein
MGAAAFVMADMTGTPYSSIIICALLPGLLYYFSLGLQVYLEAGKLGIQGEPASALPQLKKVLQAGYYHLIPIGVLIYLLFIEELSANYAAVFAIAVMIAVGAAKTLLIERRFPLRELMQSAVNAARTTVPVMTACGAAGIVIGIVSMTGIGVKFTQIVFALAGHSTFAMLCMVMVACLVLGMGLPSTAAYVIAAAVGAPALIKADIPVLAANMFVFYFAILSFITPPVAIAAYAAAGISKGDPMRTGFLAFFLGLSGFIIPFIYVYRPGLLILGTSAGETLYILFLTALAIIMLAGALEGWMGQRMHPVQRIIMLAVAFMLIFPDTLSDAIGIGLSIVILCRQFISWKKNPARTQTTP